MAKKTDSNADLPVYLFREGRNCRAYEYFGSHAVEGGVAFRVWAPHAKAISVTGSFNNWDDTANPMEIISEGVWEAVIPGVNIYDTYKYSIETQSGAKIMKADPYAFHSETRPANASKYYEMDGYEWRDSAYVKNRAEKDCYSSPMNIYELHAGSWKKYENGEPYSYCTLADELVPYLKEMGYTHVEFLPVTEHPFDGSWGYQVTGYFSVTSRFGTPHDFMYLVDSLHRAGIGVILDWVPAHFPKDAYGLYEFDGDVCYEYADPFKQEHKDWGTRVFDYGKNEVISFLVSSAEFFFDMFHIDGIRVDAVASMLYLDYGRNGGQWRPNIYGGRENLEAVAFLRYLNECIFRDYPYALMIAEESTAWPLVTKPVSAGGLGFNFKWNMGWMNDILRYASMDGLSKGYNHNLVTFSLFYAFSENFILPISHDEVVHGKRSLLDKMPGEYDEKFRNLKVFLGYMYAHPGKKLLFMGQDFGQFIEWNEKRQLDWFLLDFDSHRLLHEYTKKLFNFYKDNSELWQIDFSWEGFNWLVVDDNCNSVVAFERINAKGEKIVAVCNFTPVTRENYRIGVEKRGVLTVVLDSEDKSFGGCGTAQKKIYTKKIPSHNKENSFEMTLPGLSCVYLKYTEYKSNNNTKPVKGKEK